VKLGKSGEAVHGCGRCRQKDGGNVAMLKPITISTLAVALAVAAWSLAPLRADRAAAESGPLTVVAVDIDVVPGEMDNYLAAIKENGAASVQEPGCRAFNIAVSQKDANHVLLYEVYDNDAAVEAHRATDHFKKYQATVAKMVAKRELRAFSAVAMNAKSL
jgi:(4S)-4-hydroxy-5-phosphonooxypentane-2,3-dione isomerase